MGRSCHRVVVAGILLILAADDVSAFGRRRCCQVVCCAPVYCEPAYSAAWVTTAPRATARPLDVPACTGPVQLGNDQLAGHSGMFIPANVLQPGQFHHFTVITDPGRAAFNFTSEAVDLIG